MKLNFRGQYNLSSDTLMRRAGYGRIVNKQGKISYVRRFTRGEYPRFHLYLREYNGGFEVNLHLDQKAPSYWGHTAHSGEYDGLAVENEAARIKAIIEEYK